MKKILFEITKEAIKLIQSGQATLSSGGVRLLTGEIFELAKPVASVAKNALGSISLGPAGAAIGLASSLAQNVQTGILQHSVNVANAKLDQVIEQLNSFATALQGLQQIQALSWVTMGFSLANIGISVAGFQMTLKKLDQIQGQIKEFYDRYKEDRQSDRIEAFRNCLQSMKAHLGFLQEKYSSASYDDQNFIQREALIEKDIITTCNFIHSVKEEFVANRIDRQIGCQILFVLLPVYAQTMNEFCCQYYYLHGFQHRLYADWLAVIHEMNDDAFRAGMKHFLTFDKAYATLPMETKKNAYRVAFESIRQQSDRLALCEKAIRQMTFEEYAGIENTLNQFVYAALPESVEELKGIDLDAALTQQITNGHYAITDDEMVVLSVNT